MIAKFPKYNSKRLDGIDLRYFTDRQILIDFRGNVKIHPGSHWGFRVMVLSSSHDISTGEFGEVLYRTVEVEEGAWIASGAILYNCKIGKNAVVAAGSVVKNMTVPENTMVEGNPAKIVAFFAGGKWRRIND